MPRVPGMQFLTPMEMLVTPCPVDWAVASARTPQGKQVVVQLLSANGLYTFFFPEDAAKKLGEALTQAAGAGLVIVPAGAVPR